MILKLQYNPAGLQLLYYSYDISLLIYACFEERGRNPSYQTLSCMDLTWFRNEPSLARAPVWVFDDVLVDVF